MSVKNCVCVEGGGVNVTAEVNVWGRVSMVDCVTVEEVSAWAVSTCMRISGKVECVLCTPEGGFV